MKKALFGLVIAVMGLMALSAPIMEAPSVYAETEECTCKGGGKGTRPKTAIIGQGTRTGCECGNGEGVRSILSFIVNMMTMGIGILGVLGITIVGIQYLTAGGNEEKTRKAKRRMFEIVIGLVTYVLIYALLNFLVPDFSPLGT